MRLAGRKPYYLRLRVGAAKTRAEIYHYYALKEYLEDEFGIHYSFGDSDTWYGTKVINAFAGHVNYENVKLWVSDYFEAWRISSVGRMYELSKGSYMRAMSLIEDDVAQAMSEDELQEMVTGIYKYLPKNKKGRCGR